MRKPVKKLSKKPHVQQFNKLELIIKLDRKNSSGILNDAYQK